LLLLFWFLSTSFESIKSTVYFVSIVCTCIQLLTTELFKISVKSSK